MIGFGLILLGIIFLIVTFAQWCSERKYKKNGIICSAKVIDTKTGYARINGRRVTTYFRIVTYNVDGENVTAELASIPQDMENAVGKEIQIKYLKNKPKKIILNDDARAKRNLKVLLYVSLGLIAVGIIAFLINYFK